MAVILDKATKVKIAKRARQLINRGWARGAWRRFPSETGKKYDSFCLEGACNQAAIDVLGDDAIEIGAAYPRCGGEEIVLTPANSGQFTRRLSVAKAVRKYTKERYGKEARSAHAFNDRPGTKKSDVIAVLDLYIEENS